MNSNICVNQEIYDKIKEGAVNTFITPVNEFIELKDYKEPGFYYHRAKSPKDVYDENNNIAITKNQIVTFISKEKGLYEYCRFNKSPMYSYSPYIDNIYCLDGKSSVQVMIIHFKILEWKDVTEEQIEKAGYRDRDHFYETMDILEDKSKAYHKVWVISFRLVYQTLLEKI